MDMKSFLRTLAHGFVSAAAVTAASAAASGAPITSGNVLIPAAVAGIFGMLHALMPSTMPTAADALQAVQAANPVQASPAPTEPKQP